MYIITVIYLLLIKKKDIAYLIFMTIFFVYLYYVIDYTQFPIYNIEAQKEAFGGQNVLRDMNLTPFPFHPFSKANFLNIILTIPLGFAIPFLIRANIKKVFIIGLATTIIIELFQLLVALYVGYTFRYVDINDVIFNTLGTLIGYLVFFKAFKYVYKYFIKKLQISSSKNIILSHISRYVNQ